MHKDESVDFKSSTELESEEKNTNLLKICICTFEWEKNEERIKKDVFKTE